VLDKQFNVDDQENVPIYDVDKKQGCSYRHRQQQAENGETTLTYPQ
jgi:hypothetical protein